MKINTVAITEDGTFCVNGDMYVPDNMGNSHRVMIQEWIDAGNVPEPYVGPTDLENWVEEMARSDKTLLPRTMEDMLDGMPDKSGVAQITLDKLQAKKDLRATKP
jgi:hypothetical protein